MSSEAREQVAQVPEDLTANNAIRLLETADLNPQQLEQILRLVLKNGSRLPESALLSLGTYASISGRVAKILKRESTGKPRTPLQADRFRGADLAIFSGLLEASTIPVPYPQDIDYERAVEDGKTEGVARSLEYLCSILGRVELLENELLRIAKNTTPEEYKEWIGQLGDQVGGALAVNRVYLGVDQDGRKVLSLPTDFIIKELAKVNPDKDMHSMGYFVHWIKGLHSQLESFQRGVEEKSLLRDVNYFVRERVTPEWLTRRLTFPSESF